MQKLNLHLHQKSLYDTASASPTDGVSKSRVVETALNIFHLCSSATKLPHLNIQENEYQFNFLSTKIQTRVARLG